MKKCLVPLAMALAALALVILSACGQVEDASRIKSAPTEEAQTEPEGNREVGGMPAEIRVSYIDVGKGDCILIQTGGKAVLIDTGYEETADDVASYLRDCGIEHLDTLVITHFDKDHIGGTRALGEAFAPREVLLPGYTGADKQYRSLMAAVTDLELPAQKVLEERSLDLDGPTLTIYPTSLTYVPDANGDEGNDNDLSLVATLVSGDDTYLFAGDLEEEGIDAYLAAEQGAFDVLKMPHHGEKSASTADLVEAVQPQVAVITDSVDEPADKKTLKILKKAGVDTYRTSEQGTIVVTSAGTGSYEVSCAR